MHRVSGRIQTQVLSIMSLLRWGSLEGSGMDCPHKRFYPDKAVDGEKSGCVFVSKSIRYVFATF